MTIFVFEYLTGGGLFVDGLAPEACPTLVAEGTAMRNALLADVAALRRPVRLLCDTRLPTPQWPTSSTIAPIVSTEQVDSAEQFTAAFDRAIEQSEAAWIIAPETGGALLQLTERAEGRVELWSPASDLVRLATDKQRLLEFLAGRGIAAPSGTLLSQDTLPDVARQLEMQIPQIVKPNDGAGSQDVRKLGADDVGKLDILLHGLPNGAARSPLRIEPFIAGQPLSVSVLGADDAYLVLEPCLQEISDDGHFIYLGGSLPIPDDFREETLQVAEKVAASLPAWRGIVGIDMIWGQTGPVVGPVVLEVNPRLTTSYVGLRKWYCQNLVKIVAESQPGVLPSLSAGNFQLQFDADGKVHEVQDKLLDKLLDNGAVAASSNSRPSDLFQASRQYRWHRR